MTYKIVGYQVEIQRSSTAISQGLTVRQSTLQKSSLCCDLPFKQRIIFILWLAGFDRKEMARVTGVSISCINQHIAKARKKYPLAKQAFSSQAIFSPRREYATGTKDTEYG
jgi:hypothetical protein